MYITRGFCDFYKKGLKKQMMRELSFNLDGIASKKYVSHEARICWYRRLLFTKENYVSTLNSCISQTSMRIDDCFMDRVRYAPYEAKTRNSTWELDPWRQTTIHGSAIVIQHQHPRFIYTTNFHYSLISFMNMVTQTNSCLSGMLDCSWKL